MLRIALLDKNELFRDSLKSLINNFPKMHVSLSVASVDELKTYGGLENFDILIFDVVCSESEEDCDKLKSVIRRYPELKTIVITDLINKNVVMKLIQAGITAYYSKKMSAWELEKIIHTIAQTPKGLTTKLGPIVRERLVNSEIFSTGSSNFQDSVKFSQREIQILELASREMTNKQIATRLGISMRTVETHRRRMVNKTGSRNMTGVIIFAVRNNIPIGEVKHVEDLDESDF